jgi:hypothetical protein
MADRPRRLTVRSKYLIAPTPIVKVKNCKRKKKIIENISTAV